LQDILDVARRDSVMALTANKPARSRDHLMVSEEASKFAKSHSMQYFSISIQTDAGITHARERCFAAIENNIGERTYGIAWATTETNLESKAKGAAT
jgi:hypothetical protein